VSDGGNKQFQDLGVEVGELRRLPQLCQARKYRLGNTGEDMS